MNNKIEIIKAMVNKPIKVEIKAEVMELELQLNDIDYEDIYDNIDDYEYPYNHINRSDL